MPELTSHQSYELEKPPATPDRSQAITHYINQPTMKSQAETIANAYSLHVEHYSMKKKRELVMKQNGTWRENLNILRTIPRPKEEQLLLKGGENPHVKLKKKGKAATSQSTDNKTGENHQQKHGRQHGSVKNRSHILRLSASAHQESESKAKEVQNLLSAGDTAANMAASLGEILDPQVSSGERYDKYIKDIERDKELDKDDLASLYSHPRSEQQLKEEALEMEGKARHNDVSLEAEEFEDSDKEYTFEVVDTSRFNSRNKDLNNYLSERVGEVRISSRVPSKAPSRIGRVSSLGLDGRISVMGTHFNEKVSSRLSMASDREGGGKGYISRDHGEVTRKVYIPRDEGSTSRGVDRDIKLMHYLTKHSKVTAPVEGGLSGAEVKKKLKPSKNAKVYNHRGQGQDEKEVTEVKGGGFKLIKSASRNKKKANETVVTQLRNRKCEIQTQTDI